MKTSKRKHAEQNQSALTRQPPTPLDTLEQIRQRANELFKARGSQGHPLIDWLQAEHELKVEMSRQKDENRAVPAKYYYLLRAEF